MPHSESYNLRTASRLHFGLFGGRQVNGVSFGGIGAMVEQPGVQISIEKCDRREYAGLQSERLRSFAESWFNFTGLKTSAEFRLELDNSPDSHVGLGTGTQIGLAVATLLFQFYFDEVPGIETIAKSVSRGARSGVGTYGFQYGGFIVDRGKKKNSELADLDVHLPIPENWRFLLVRTAKTTSLSGPKENQVFSRPDGDLQQNYETLVRITKERILPAILKEDFDEFSESVFEFGKTSGSYFQDIQGGPFNGDRITTLVDHARRHSISGVGQSSWGPTVFMLAKTPEEANRIADLVSPFLLSDESMLITPPMNEGFQLSSVHQATP